MTATLVRRLFARYPGLRWAVAGALQRVPAVDRRLRAAFGKAHARPAPLRLDADHLPDDAQAVYRALADAVGRRPRR